LGLRLDDQLGQSADRRGTAGVEGGQEAAFGVRHRPGWCVVEHPELCRGERVVAAALDCQHALRRSRHE
jgi:hypothetical protein